MSRRILRQLAFVACGVQITAGTMYGITTVDNYLSAFPGTVTMDGFMILFAYGFVTACPRMALEAGNAYHEYCDQQPEYRE